MMPNFLRYGLLSLMIVIASCTGDPGTGPVDVKWDRDTCERCRMVLSDRLHSAQVRGGPAGEKAKVYKFDDIGCAVIWLEDKAWKDDPGTEIWVTEHQSGEWLNARKAFYMKGELTPMEYGLGAQLESAPGALNFAQAKEHIFAVEARFNVHGSHLKDAAGQRNPETGKE